MFWKAGHFARVKTGDFPMTDNQAVENVIIANEVDDEQRLDFLPEFFGSNLMLVGENYTYNTLSKLSKDYNGGLWKFYKLSNGGFYMAPHMSRKLSVMVHGNYYEGEVSADAAGIIATLFTLCALCHQFPSDRYIDLYDHLRDYVSFHPESSEIFRAID
jgi:hypothetical protein